jgi:ferrous iron transport protein B
MTSKKANTAHHKIYLLGHANTGKTSLFNIITDSDNKVANYHGATTSLSRKAMSAHPEYEVYDLPGTYSLTGHSKDETLTLETLKNAEQNSSLVFVIDAINLKTHLKNLKGFLSKFSELKRDVILVINMMDEVSDEEVKTNTTKLESTLQIPILYVSARNKTGIDELITVLSKVKTRKPTLLSTLSSRLDLFSEKEFTRTVSPISIKRMYALDKYLISPFVGLFIFVILMTALFQAIFSWSAPFMDGIEALFIFMSEMTSPYFTSPYLKSFVEDAFWGGLGAFLVFTPQIFFLSFIIKTFEETGYLARASILCHRFLVFFGLSGESFIPILTSHACAIPGAYAARHIKSKRTRILTLLTLPLTLCSARLPVYALLITLLIPNTTIMFGLIGARGFMLFGLYLFGLLLTVSVSLVLHKTTFKKSSRPILALELPRYQIPNFKLCFKNSLRTTYHFIRDAGLIIFATNVVIWLAATFPNGPGNLRTSYLATVGKFLAPLTAPIGLDWPETIALITSFLARETFVSTLGTLFGTNSDEIAPLSELMAAQNYSVASSLSLIVFFAIALQCVSTLAVLKKELPKKNTVYYLFFGYLAFAYAASFITYRTALFFT